MILPSNSCRLLIRTEMMKLKGTPAMWLTLLGAALLPCAYFIGLLRSAGQLLTMTINPWNYLFTKEWSTLAFLLLPLYAVLITSLLVHTEYQAKGWKHLLTLPIERSAVFMSKLVIILLLLVSCYILFIMLSFLTGILLNACYPGLTFFTYRPGYPEIFMTAAKSFISLLGIVAFQYWLSLRFKNFIVPIGIGMAGIILSGIIFHHWKYEYFYLYLQPTLSLIHHSEKTSTFSLVQAEWISLLYFLLFTAGNYLDFAGRKRY